MERNVCDKKITGKQNLPHHGISKHELKTENFQCIHYDKLLKTRYSLRNHLHWNYAKAVALEHNENDENEIIADTTNDDSEINDENSVTDVSFWETSETETEAAEDYLTDC